MTATRIGAARTPDGGFRPDTSPESLRTQVEQNLRDLRLDCLPLVHFRYLPDGPTPFPKAIGTMIELRRRGLIKEIGISHVTLTQLDQAVRLTPIASIENPARFGAAEPDPVLTGAAEASIPYLAYRPLENGALLGADGPRNDHDRRMDRPADRRGAGDRLGAQALRGVNSFDSPRASPGRSRSSSVRSSLSRCC